MKNVVLMAMIGVGATLALSGCGKSAIECDNGDAKKLVMEIAESEIKNQLHALLDSGRMRWSENLMALSKTKEITDDDYTRETERIYEESNPQLTNIRTENINDKLERSQCAAEISYINGNKIDITYNLSKTSDDKLYAEVFGLR